MANEKKISGTDFMLFIDPEGGTNYKLIVCLTEQNYNRATNEIDAKSKCGPDKRPGTQEVNLDFKGQIVYLPAVGQISEWDLNQYWKDKRTLGWKLARVEPQEGDGVYWGTGFISKLNAAYPLDGVSTFDGAIGIFGLPEDAQLTTPGMPTLVTVNFDTDHFVVNITAAAGYESTMHQYTTNGGTTWTDQAPGVDFFLPNTGVAAGNFLIRVKAENGTTPGQNYNGGQILFVPAAPTITDEDDTANTIAFDQVYPAADMEYSLDGGTTWTSPAASPVSITGDLPAGDFIVRVKQSIPALRAVSQGAASTIEFTT